MDHVTKGGTISSLPYECAARVGGSGDRADSAPSESSHSEGSSALSGSSADAEEERNTPIDKELSLAAKVEGLLFVADAPVSVGRIAEVLGVTVLRIERALSELVTTYVGRGLHLQRVGSQVQLTTSPQAASCIEHFLGLEARVALSRAALETLAIIAYRQPITRPWIETIRGVGSDSVLRTLLRTGLIAEEGRAPTVGHPILYGTTFDFLQHFGLSGLNELPPLDDQSTDGGTA